MVNKKDFLINGLMNGSIAYNDPRVELPITDEKLAVACLNALDSKARSIYLNYSENQKVVIHVFKNLSAELKENIYVIKSFIAKNPKLYEIISDKMKKNNSVIKTALKADKRIFSSLTIEQQKNKEYIDLIINTQMSILYFNQEVLKDKNIVLYILDKNIDTINSAPSFLLEDEEICRFLLKKSINKIEMIKNNKVRNDPKIAKKILEKNDKLFQYLGNEIKNDKMIAEKAVELYANNYSYISKYLQKDKEIAFKAIKIKGMFPYLNEALLEDKSFVRDALKINIEIESYLSEEDLSHMLDIEYFEEINGKNEKFAFYIQNSRLKELLETKRRVRDLYKILESNDVPEVTRKKVKI